MGMRVQRRGGGIDLGHRGPGAQGAQRQFGGGMDQGRGADAEKQIAVASGGQRGLPGVGGQAFAEPDDAGPDRRAAVQARGGRERAAGSRFVLCCIFWRGGGAPPAGAAARRVQTAMQMDHAAAAGALMQVVDVLRDQRHRGHLPRQRGDGVMGCVRLGTRHLGAAPFIPTPHQIGLRRKGLRGGERARVEARPQAGQGIAERGDAAFGGHAGSGEDEHVPRPRQGVGERGRDGSKIGVHAWPAMMSEAVTLPARTRCCQARRGAASGTRVGRGPGRARCRLR